MRLPGITHERVTWLLAPHIHIAMRGTLSRTELRQALPGTYHQVWWPRTDQVQHDDAGLPIWHEAQR